MQKNTEYFYTLNSLRGFAALTIAVYHYDTRWAGYLAVDFFLILSGFILAHNYLYKEAIPFKTAVIKRLARLYPLHIFTLFTFIIAYFFTHNYHFPQYENDGTIFTFFQQLTLTHSVGFNPSGITWNKPSWSISVEFWVNILFFLFIRKNTKSSYIVLISLLCWGLIFRIDGHFDTITANYLGFLSSGLLRGIAGFGLGIIAYRIWKKVNYKQFSYWLISGLELASILLIGVIIFVREGKSSQLDFAAPLAFSFLIIVCSLEKGVVSQILKKFNYLGIISYSIYLNHFGMLLFVRLFPYNWKITLPIYVILLVIYSHFTYKYIEFPLRKKILSGKKKY